MYGTQHGLLIALCSIRYLCLQLKHVELRSIQGLAVWVRRVHELHDWRHANVETFWICHCRFVMRIENRTPARRYHGNGVDSAIL